MVLAGGLGTPYYAGLNLLMIVLATAVPLRMSQLLPLLLFLVVQVNLVDLFFVDTRNADLVFVANSFLGDGAHRCTRQFSAYSAASKTIQSPTSA